MIVPGYLKTRVVLGGKETVLIIKKHKLQNPSVLEDRKK